MNDLRESMQRAADSMLPSPDLEDVYRRASRRSAGPRHVVVPLLVAAVVAGLVVPFLVASGRHGGPESTRPGTSPSTRSSVTTTTTASPPSSGPQAVRLVATFRAGSVPFTAAGGALYSVRASGPCAPSPATEPSWLVTQVIPGRTATHQRVTDPLACYLSAIAAQGQSLYLGTNVIERFANASDEVVRLDASTLQVATRTTVPGGVVGLVADAGNLWVALPDRVLLLDPVSLALRASYVIPGAVPPPVGASSISSIGLGPSGLWMTYASAGQATLYHLDQSSLAVLGATPISGPAQGIRVVAGAQSAWLVGQDFIRRIDQSGGLAAPTPIAGLQAAAAQGTGLGVLLAANGSSETFVQFDAAGSAVARTEVGDSGAVMAIDGSDVWLLHGSGLALWVLQHPEP